MVLSRYYNDSKASLSLSLSLPLSLSLSRSSKYYPCVASSYFLSIIASSHLKISFTRCQQVRERLALRHVVRVLFETFPEKLHRSRARVRSRVDDCTVGRRCSFFSVVLRGFVRDRSRSHDGIRHSVADARSGAPHHPLANHRRHAAEQGTAAFCSSRRGWGARRNRAQSGPCGRNLHRRLVFCPFLRSFVCVKVKKQSCLSFRLLSKHFYIIHTTIRVPRYYYYER